MAVLGVTVVAFLAVSVAGAFADAGNPILETIRATEIDNGNGTVTISVRGQWVWLSHSKDCNTSRAATGVGIIWNDPTEPGFTVSNKKGDVSAQVGIKTLRAEDTVNKVDQMVHPVDRGNVPEGYTTAGADYPTGQAIVDPSPPNPASFATWKGGCGRTPLTATASKGSHPERTGRTCGSGTLECSGHPWGSWGYEQKYSHTYLKTALPSQVCANFYDVHGGGEVGTGAFQAVNSAKEVTVDDNGDNSIEKNDFNVNQGANCISTPMGTIELKKQFVDGPTSARANLSIIQGGTALVVGSKADAASGEGTGVLTVLAGSYDISELAGTNTSFSDYSSDVACTGGALSGVSGEKRAGSVAVGTNAHVVCTFTNTFLKKSPTLETNAGGPYRVDENGKALLTDSATLTGATSDAGGTVTFTLYGPDPTPGSDASDDCVVVAGTATASVSGGIVAPSSPAVAVGMGSYHWTASYSGDSSNNSATSACGAENENPFVIAPSIRIEKSPDSQTIVTGTAATFTIKVTNTGDVDLTNVFVTDVNAPGCDKTIGVLAAGVPFTYVCTLLNVKAGFTNSATATGHPPVGPNVTSTDTADVVVIAPSIRIEKGPDAQTVARGSTVTFTIEVTNTGDVKLTNVVVADAQAPGCGKSIGDMIPGAIVNYTCTLANVTSDLTNVAIVSGTPPVGPVVTDSNDAKVTIGTPPPTPSPPTTPTPPATADAAIQKDATAQVALGSNGKATIVYDLRVQNNGPAPAAGVTVSDRAPDGVTFSSVTQQPSQGSCSISPDGLLLSCAIGTLATGQSVVIRVSATVTVTGTITNTATTTTTTADTNEDNNHDSAQTLVTPRVTPPTPPRPRPPPEICSTVTATPAVLKGSGKAQTISVTVTRGKKGSKGVAGATVRIRGPGVSKTVKTGKKGRVSVTVKPTKPGIIKVEIQNMKACNSLRIGVVGSFKPPVTG